MTRSQTTGLYQLTRRWAWRAGEILHLLVGWGLRVLQVVTLGQLPPLVGVGAAVLHEDRVLALLRYDGLYALPGGTMRYGETCDSALRRELLEETGVEVTIEGLVGVYSGPAKGRNVRAVVVVYRCRWTAGSLHGSYEGEPLWLPLEALPPSDRWAFGSDEVLHDLLAGHVNLF